MSAFLCNLWPYLFGGLLAWLICGFLARKLKYAEPKEKLVEKEVEVIVEKQVETVVEIEVERDSSAYLEKIAGLESQVEELASLRSKMVELEASAVESAVQPDKGSLVDDPVLTSGLGFLSDTSSFSDADIAAKDAEISEWKTRYAELEAKLAKSSSSSPGSQVIDLKAAKAAGFKVKGENDFTVIEGIGPKINDLIHDAGIDTYYVFSKTKASVIQQILNEAGSNYSLANPKTWSKQAGLAADNRWVELKSWQDELDGGV